MSSLWQRLRDALRRRATVPGRPGRARAGSAAPPPSLPATLPIEDDALRIYTYTRRIGPLDERPERCDPEILAALTRLWQSGREAQAVTLGGALASAIPDDARLQLAVAELLLVQREYGSAVPLLQRALASVQASRDERLRARFLLHEAALAADDAATAVTHLSELLAEDFAYPGARARLAALHGRGPAGRLAGGGSGGPLDALGSEVAAPPSPGPGSGLTAPAAPTLIGLPGGPEARYQLLRELGCGSAGTVYLALDTELSCEVALKVFYPRRRGGGGDEALLRALHEARLLAAVRHPGVIALYDIAGELADEPGAHGPPRLAMELCRGGSLRARLRTGPLPIRAALQRGAELLSTLAAVHRTGVVHGDLKPENLLFRGPELYRGELPPAEASRGDLVLSDFGLARLGAGEASRGLGTLGYSAPERLTTALADAASDVYSAAAVVVEMLCGELLRTRAEVRSGSSPLNLVAPERWAAVTTALGAPGEALGALLAQLLARDPATRPTAAAALQQLQAILAQVPERPDRPDRPEQPERPHV